MNAWWMGSCHKYLLGRAQIVFAVPMIYWCFQGRKWEGFFVNKQFLCIMYDAGVIRLENEEVFLWNFLEDPKLILRPAQLNPFLSGQDFAIPVSGSFSYIGTLSC